MFRRMFNHAKRLSLAARKWVKRDRFKAAHLVVLLLILPLVACQSATYKEAYAEAIEDGKDDSAAAIYAKYYERGYLKARKVRKARTRKVDGFAETQARVYAKNYADALVGGSNESYAQNYAQAIVDGNSKKYAHTYAYVLEYKKVNDAYAQELCTNNF